MRIVLILISSLLLSFSAYAADDASNKANFEKECAAMIAPDGACGNVVAGGGGRRGCVSKPENFEKATPACKAVIEEWRAMQKK
ncbi:hypothetical protein [uncultured Desulfobulbus sp.]|jgi:hypothetical protein|uniref:hypothetical protein n=1 Tax=uncultured Desulfobulbus sp. TaxID=239745 RepID=UPI0029C9AA95|nr:hypothetical protein [uncultured Desulfobulbus sp.]